MKISEDPWTQIEEYAGLDTSKAELLREINTHVQVKGFVKELDLKRLLDDGHFENRQAVQEELNNLVRNNLDKYRTDMQPPQKILQREGVFPSKHQAIPAVLNTLKSARKKDRPTPGIIVRELNSKLSEVNKRDLSSDSTLHSVS